MAEPREWTDPKTGTVVRVGDVWRDHDPRGERGVHIQCVDEHHVTYITVGAPSTRKPSQSRTHLFVKRFTLVSRVPEPTPADPEALKPCPFCGRNPVVLILTRTASVECRSCGGRGPWANTPDEAEARRLWNTRAEAGR